MKRVRVIVSGLVQGVFFRAHARDEAERRGLGGWVRNLPDGRVEVAIEGEDKSVDEMIEWCRTGPPSARVSGIEVFAEKPTGEVGFTIRY